MLLTLTVLHGLRFRHSKDKCGKEKSSEEICELHGTRQSSGLRKVKKVERKRERKKCVVHDWHPANMTVSRKTRVVTHTSS